MPYKASSNIYIVTIKKEEESVRYITDVYSRDPSVSFDFWLVYLYRSTHIATQVTHQQKGTQLPSIEAFKTFFRKT
ncbi:Uncharacterized protein APZ42_033694 [Daphnia magna]|uniref:Uncharacterized protein n=1 Tax=Daphnia magna TaxID=35525 RepID=A0A164KSZ6_9CRUS|nr:Uncharacterized protein APZ42_033694 [Daphnia magna]